MQPMVGVLLHDRPELAERCFASLKHRPGKRYHLAIHLDGANEELEALAHKQKPLVLDITPQPVGTGEGLNRLLKYRAPGQAFCRVDSDIEFLTDRWLARLMDGLDEYGCIAPVWAEPPYCSGVSPGETYQPVGNTCSGVWMFSGKVMDRLGAFRSYGRQGFDDLDFHARMTAAGYETAYDRRVHVRHPGRSKVDIDPRLREWREDAMRRFKGREQHYILGRDIHEPLDVASPHSPYTAVLQGKA